MCKYTDESVLKAVNALHEQNYDRIKIFIDFIKVGFNIKLPLIFGVKEATLHLTYLSAAANTVYTAAEIFDFCEKEKRNGNWVTNFYNIVDLQLLEFKNLPLVMAMYVDVRKELSRVEESTETVLKIHFCKYFLKNVLPKYALDHPKSRGMNGEYELLCLSLLSGQYLTDLKLITNLEQVEL